MVNNEKVEMISLKNRFLFFHISKCAGTSIRHVLEPYASFNGVQSYLHQHFDIYGERFWYHYHSDPSGIMKYLADVVSSDFFCFTFVRNPYDRIVSAWRYLAPNKAFSWFVAHLDNLPNYHDRVHVMPIVKTTEALDDAFGIDFVGRNESIQLDFAYVCQQVGIPQVQLPRLNASKHEHYSQYYGDATKAAVSNLYAEDLERFSYQFEERQTLDSHEAGVSND